MTAQTILPANTLSSGYDVDNGIRFDGSSSYMTMTPGSAGSQKIVTFSTWIKRSQLGEGSGPADVFMMYGYAGSSSDTRLYFTGDGNAADDRLYFQSTTSNTTHTALATNRKFRDPNAWYHIVINYNSSVSSPDTNHVEMFINGVKETSFVTETYPSQNDVVYWTDDSLHTIARRSDGGNLWYGGYMAETVMIDGQALDADSFGEFDSDSGIWKPIDVSGLTFGTNGFYLQYKGSGTSANSSGLGADTSGNDHHFAVSGLAATDQTTDTCTNNHATLNLLFPEANITYSEGNLKVTADGSQNWSSAIGNIGLSSGKWYWEWTATSSSNAFAGLASEALVNSTLISDATPYDQNGLILYFTDGRKTVDGSNTESHFTGWSSGTMSCALDLDSGTRTAKFYHNGSQTGDTINLTANFASGDNVFPVFMVNAGSNPSLINVNFGSPFYANSSDAADANGYGAFEFAPPSGYYAINTKNLAEYGG
jgi:hypothetical protein